MNAACSSIIEKYDYLNQYASPGQIVFFGSSYLDQFPIYELKEDYAMNQTIFKRTLPGAKISDAAECLDSCVLRLHPSKLFIGFGDEDVNAPSFSAALFAAQYRKILETLRQRLPHCEIYLLGIPCSGHGTDLNLKVAQLAQEFHFELIHLGNSQYPAYADEFRHIKVFLHPRRLKLSDALSL